jgi:predicted hydrocarbon binding protein
MKYVKISQRDLTNIRKLYENVMSYACHGLFYREGTLIGKEIIEESSVDRSNLFTVIPDILKDRGWVENITLDAYKAVAEGSIEVNESKMKSCHRLRGILSYIYEYYHGTKIVCTEIECASITAKNCVFKIELGK